MDLLRIKQKLKGSIKLRTNSKAFWYRLHNKDGIIKALNKLNGLFRNSKRLIKLKNLCQKINIPYKTPIPLTLENVENAWFAVFFDTDGTLGYSFANNWPKLEISVSNKKRIVSFLNIFLMGIFI